MLHYQPSMISYPAAGGAEADPLATPQTRSDTADHLHSDRRNRIDQMRSADGPCGPACVQNPPLADRRIADHAVAVRPVRQTAGCNAFGKSGDRCPQAAGLAPRWLELEITESLLMRDTEKDDRNHAPAGWAVQFAVDDFPASVIPV